MHQLALLFLLLQQPVEAPKGLIEASERGEVAKIRTFAEHAAFVGVDSNGRTALLAAAQKEQRAAFAELIAITNEKVKKQIVRLPTEGQPAVMIAMVAVHERMTLFSKADKDGITPLMYAAGYGWDDLVRQLIDGGAKLAANDAAGHSAADYAERAGHSALANMLREAAK
jgi:hypothetical protein